MLRPAFLCWFCFCLWHFLLLLISVWFSHRKVSISCFGLLFFWVFSVLPQLVLFVHLHFSLLFNLSFSSMFGVITKESVSLKRDAVCPVRWEWSRAAPHVCAVDTATWSLPPFLAWGGIDPWMTPPPPSPRDQVTQLWPANLPADPLGLAPLWLRMQWLWTEGAMLVQMCPVKYGKVSLQHARLLASSPVGLCSDRAPDSALDADERETYQLQLHCVAGWLIKSGFKIIIWQMLYSTPESQIIMTL